MKMLLCIPQLKKGGAERVICNLANYFVKSNSVILYSMKEYSPAYKIDQNVKLYIHKTTTTNVIKENLARIKEVKNIIKNEKIDIILSFLPQAAFLSLISRGIRKKTKVIISVRNDPKVEYKKVIFKILMRLLYPKADAFVFQTQDARDYFPKSIQQKSTIIPNSLNKDFMVQRPSHNREKVIVSVGRLFEQKNHLLLIKAFEEFDKKVSGYKLLILGEGPLYPKLSDCINNKKINDKVILMGQVDDIKEKIYNATIFVLSSNYEGMPNALMEAMALGIPCVSTDCPCGGPKQLINNGENGYLVPVNDYKGLSEKMIELASNKETRIKFSNNAIKTMEKYNPEIINKKWIDYIKYIYKK